MYYKIALKDYFSGISEFLICYIFIFIQFKITFTWLFDLFFHPVLFRSVIFSYHIFGKCTEIFVLFLGITWILNLQSFFLWFRILSALVNVSCTLELHCFLVKWFIIINYVRFIWCYYSKLLYFYWFSFYSFCKFWRERYQSNLCFFIYIEIPDHICGLYSCGLWFLFASLYLEWISYRQQ